MLIFSIAGSRKSEDRSLKSGAVRPRSEEKDSNLPTSVFWLLAIEKISINFINNFLLPNTFMPFLINCLILHNHRFEAVMIHKYRKMKIACLLLLICIMLEANAQEIIEISTNTNPTHIRTPPSRLVLMIFTYQSDTIFYEGSRYIITPPKNRQSQEAAYAFLYYEGNSKKRVPADALLFLDGYKGYTSNIYVDSNFNLNFNDDEAPQKLKDSLDIITIKLNNTEEPAAEYVVDIQFIRYKNEQQRAMAKAYPIDNHPVYRGNRLNDHHYWLTETRKNYLTFDAFLKKDSVKLALVDGNADGLYNGIGDDKILVGDYKTNSIDDKQGEGNFVVGENTVIKVHDQCYQIAEIEPTGKFIKLLPTAKSRFDTAHPDYLEKGDIIPNLAYKTLEGENTSLHRSLSEEKYNLIDFWGTWCRGCVLDTDTLKQLYHKYGKKLNIIGMNYADDKQKANKYITKKNINWEHGFASEEMVKQFSIEGFPFYILVDKDKKILAFDVSLKDVESILNE